MAVSRQERIEVLEEVLEKMDDIARALRGLDDDRINAYCLAACLDGAPAPGDSSSHC